MTVQYHKYKIKILLSTHYNTLFPNTHTNIYIYIYIYIHIYIYGPDSSVGIATRYGLGGPGIESRWRRDFPHLSRPSLGPTQSPIQWVPGLSRGLNWLGRGGDYPPHLAPRLKKE